MNQNIAVYDESVSNAKIPVEAFEGEITVLDEHTAEVVMTWPGESLLEISQLPGTFRLHDLDGPVLLGCRWIDGSGPSGGWLVVYSGRMR